MSVAFMILPILMSFISQMVYGLQFESGDDQRVVLYEGDFCRLRSGAAGICKRIETCDPYYEGLRKKTIKYSSLVRCSFIRYTEVICCPLIDAKNLHNMTLGTTATTTTSTDQTVQVFQDKGKSQRPSEAACHRYSTGALTFHILDGFPVLPGEFPHMGALIYSVGGGADLELGCGSSLISERYALTAAHCVNDPLGLPKFARFGVVVWNQIYDDITPLDVEIESITLHPDFQELLRYHDIAIIKLQRDVEFSPFIRPACLYSDLDDIDPASSLVAIGWGVTSFGNKSLSDVLLKTNVTSVPLQTCNTTHIAYGTTRKYRSGLNKGQYCAFDPELRKDACQGDSGGPLQLVQQNYTSIVGIVSFGRLCGTNVPSVYARVAFYLNWIESVVWQT